jgi:hypothetical protein
VKHPDETTLHQRLLRGDYIASEEISEFYLAPLVKFISARSNFKMVDKDLIWDACVNAVFNYIKNPVSFDPTKSGLMTFLQMSARGDLLNLLRRKKLKTLPLENVALLEKDGNNILEDQFIAKEEATTKMLEFKQRRALTITSNSTTDIEAKFLALMLEGEKKTTVYAELLGITDLSFAEQKRLVKQFKDKLRLRARRNQTPQKPT